MRRLQAIPACHTGLACLQQRQKRGNAHATSHPDLGACCATLRIKTAIRAFDLHRLPWLQQTGQTAGVVTQRLDHQTQQFLAIGRATAAFGRTGNREGVRAFCAFKAGEHKLPGTVPWPVLGHGTQHFQRSLSSSATQHTCFMHLRGIAVAATPDAPSQ